MTQPIDTTLNRQRGDSREAAEKAPPAVAQIRLEELPRARNPRRVAIFSKAKKHTRVPLHFARGFESNGHQVLALHPQKLTAVVGARLGSAYLLWRVRRFRPDLVLIYHKDIPLDVLEKLPAGTPKACFHEDVDPNPFRLSELVRCCNHVFTTGRGLIPFFRTHGAASARYLRTGCDEVDHRPVKPVARLACDVAFIGKIGADIYEDRISLIRRVNERFALNLYGSGWEELLGRAPRRAHVYPKHYRAICSSSKIVLGIDATNRIDLYFSNRTWLSLGCGAFLLTRYVPGLEELFANHHHLVWFHTPEECLELIAYYLKAEGERRRIAEAGCHYVHTYHTFRHAAAEIMSVCFGEPWPP